MLFQFTFRHMPSSEAIKNFARQRFLSEFTKFREPLRLHAVFRVENHDYIAHLEAIDGSGHVFEAVEQSLNMYESVEKALDRLSRQMAKRRGKMASHRHPPLATELMQRAAFASATNSEIDARI